jgi:hypothetical protein
MMLRQPTPLFDDLLTPVEKKRGKRSADCIQCGIQFFPVNKKVRCCSLSCSTTYRFSQAKAERPPMICEVCGKEYPWKRHPRRTCSDQCHVLSRTFSRKDRAQRFNRVCEICGKAFVTTRVEARFCSLSCNNKGPHVLIAARAEATARSLKRRRECKICGTSFAPKKRNHFTCSRKCWGLSNLKYTDKERALCSRIRTRLRTDLKRQGVVKTTKTWAALGYTVEQLRDHLEKQFRGRMSWANMGKWHIDHIVPISSFRISGLDDPEFRAAWALTNLRPLWKRDNMEKGSKQMFLI